MFKFKKILLINKYPLFLIISLVLIGLIVQFSAAGGSIFPWAIKQALRFVLGCAFALLIVCSSWRWWWTYAYPIYTLVLLLLIAVEFMGFVGMGAQRWLDLYFINLQPSELMRIALALALSKYFSDQDYHSINKLNQLIWPILLVAMPVALVMRQPDLGTAILLLSASAVVFYLGGVALKYFLIAGGVVVCALPLGWLHLHEYQRLRVLTFLNPEADAANAGYHIIQSKIALGSGGWLGKGWLKGTQSHLNFLPEKQTDFIFTMFAEEFGLIGCTFVLILFILLFTWGYQVAESCKFKFGKLLSMGLISTLFLYVVINGGMVMGLLPVVGVPMPFMSYGGTAMITIMLSMGLIACIESSHNSYKW